MKFLNISIASTLLFAAGTLSGATIGNSLINRANADGCTGCVFALNAAFPAGDTVTNWAIFSDVSAGFKITPFLIDITTDVITGLGTTRTNAASGIQGFSFGLLSGTAVVTANTRFGWRDGDGTLSGGNQGSIEWNLTPGSTTAAIWLTPLFNLSVGTNLGPPSFSANSGRYYSIQASSAPEPATWLLAGVGLALAGWRRSRRSPSTAVDEKKS